VGWRKPLVLTSLSLAATIVLWSSREVVPTYLFDGAYLVGLTQSLLSQGAYVFNFAPHTRFPPGVPALYAACGILFGTSQAVMLRAGALLGVLGSVLSYLLIEREESKRVAVAAVVLFLFSPLFFVLSTKAVNSDLPFMAISYAVLLLLKKHERSDTRQRFGTAAAVCFLLPASVLIRSAGMALIAAVGLWSIKSRYRMLWFAPALIVAVAAQVSWMMWVRGVQRVEYQGQYMQDYSAVFFMKDPHRPGLGRTTAADIPARMAVSAGQNLADFTTLVAHSGWIAPFWFSPAVYVPGILIGLGLVADSALWTLNAPEAYFICYAVLYLLWPFESEGRFLLPALPLAVLYCWRGLKFAQDALGRWRPRAIYASYLLSLVPLCGAMLYLRQHRGKQVYAAAAFWAASLAATYLLSTLPVHCAARYMGTRWPLVAALGLTIIALRGAYTDFQVARMNRLPVLSSPTHKTPLDFSSWLKSVAAPGDVVMVEENQSAVVHVATGLKTATFPVSRDTAIIRTAIDVLKPNYLLVDDGTSPYFYPTQPERAALLVKGYPELLRLVRQTEAYRVFHVVRSPHGQG
jgi:hypothetical protein